MSIQTSPRGSGKTARLIVEYYKLGAEDFCLFVAAHSRNEAYKGLPVCQVIDLGPKARGRRIRFVLADDWHDFSTKDQFEIFTFVRDRNIELLAVGTYSGGAMVYPTIEKDYFKKARQVKNWAFKAKHENQIKFDRVAEDLTIENPLALVYCDDFAFVVISNTLILKANAIHMRPDMVCPNVTLETDKYVVYSCDHDEMNLYTKWAKAVKKARWPIQNESGIVHVRIPDM